MQGLACFEPAVIALMGRVCDEAWHDIQTKNVFPAMLDKTEIRHRLARRVIAAVVEGEHDPERLKSVALRSIDD